ncbi:MAG: hypothetical protein ACRDWY_15905 [Actinomycetes bacterium]
MRRDGCEERAREGRAHTTMQWWRYQHARLAAPRPSSGGRCGPCGTLGHEQLASWVARQLCPCRDGAVANRVDQLIAAGYTDEQIARMIGATSS